jgi:LemA protein
MKKSILGVAAVFAILAVIVIGWFTTVNNQLVSMDENVKAKWSQVENVYQRRADLIPNLVNTVKGYAKHEAQVLTQVTEARASVGQVKVDNPDDLKKFDQAQGQLSSALSRLLVVAENYPQLKADRNFQDLQSQLEGTENRISVERMRFNEAAQSYNSYVRRFPQTLVASFRGFKQRPYFAAQTGAETAPRVDFNQ